LNQSIVRNRTSKLEFTSTKNGLWKVLRTLRVIILFISIHS